MTLDFNLCLTLQIFISYCLHSWIIQTCMYHPSSKLFICLLLKILIKYSASNSFQLDFHNPNNNEKKAQQNMKWIKKTNSIVDAQYVATSWYLRIWIFIFHSFYSIIIFMAHRQIYAMQFNGILNTLKYQLHILTLCMNIITIVKKELSYEMTGACCV